ncbi:ABC transporter ATP-binding protein [Abyssicoccus albus]|uniref:Oligopeptide transport system ATP-binding protein n=1 Tax=Abyssicoccus albus TaxID=1817405 RepID=A0A3N5BM17_9BACL|nr:ATP-binding cassette domain-containing protein [Abyssicoccus albus]RPF57609.1 oligopeptide transport system ATP-binding protein [Abyssicoccus albus]
MTPPKIDVKSSIRNDIVWLSDEEKEGVKLYKDGKTKLVQVRGLKQYFNEGKPNEVRAIDDVSFDIYKGETFGLVGESGCGKSTTGRTIIKLYDATAGKVIFDDVNIQDIKKRKDLAEFNRRMQMIFQDPYASLNPRLKVMDIIAEGIDIHKLSKNKQDKKERVYQLLERVGLNREHANRYPHEFSGGQRQRIGIARALAVSPDFIIADEPISALDVSIQAQVVNILQDLQREDDLTYLFIAHDLSMVKYISDRIGVMYFGKLVEIGTSDDIYNSPFHPYTKSLLSAIPHPDPESERTRVRSTYDPEVHNYDEDDVVQLREITPDHYVYCSEKEFEEYRKEANKNGYTGNLK